MTLTNGDVIHQACEFDLLEKHQSLNQKLQDYIVQKESLVAAVDSGRSEVAQFSTGSLASTLRDVFFAGPSDTREFKLSDARKKLTEAQNALSMYEKDVDVVTRKMQENIRGLKRLLTSIYDYWPDYPPDWDERRDALEEYADGQCQRCRFLKFRPNRNDTRRHFHAHHIIPLSKGGSHKLHNLKFLCSKCHQKEHAHGLREDFSSKGRSSLQTGFTAKVSLINQAIANKDTLKFKYKKRDGDIMVRTVGPASIGLDNIVHKTQVMAGFCHLRKDTRHFRISRMSQIQILR